MQVINEEFTLFQMAIDKWGKPLQLVMAVEECSELQKEVCKVLRGDWSSVRMDNIASEIADVRLMTDQLEYMFEIGAKVEIERRIKLNRLKKLVNFQPVPPPEKEGK